MKKVENSKAIYLIFPKIPDKPPAEGSDPFVALQNSVNELERLSTSTQDCNEYSYEMHATIFEAYRSLAKQLREAKGIIPMPDNQGEEENVDEQPD